METRGQFEIEQRIAAFFDLDGTLLTPPSIERRFFRLLRRRNLIGARQYLAWLREAALIFPRGIQLIAHANKMYLRGLRPNTLRLEPSSLPFYREGIERMKWHASRGHLLVLVSGTLEPLALVAAEALAKHIQNFGSGSDVRVCATRVEEKNSRWTGRILGEAMFGEEKACAIRRIATEASLDLQRCFAYGNSSLDYPMLAVVGRPVAVNPSLDLAPIARRNDWTILRWSELSDSAVHAPVSPKVENQNGSLSMELHPAAAEQRKAAIAERGLNT